MAAEPRRVDVFAGFTGAMTLGSLFWGGLASRISIPAAFMVAGGGLVLSVAALWRFKIPEGTQNFAPSQHWHDPVTSIEPSAEAGPVLITTEWEIAPDDARVRGGDGADSPHAPARWRAALEPVPGRRRAESLAGNHAGRVVERPFAPARPRVAGQRRTRSPGAQFSSRRGRAARFASDRGQCAHV
ncbi:MAG: MFS transporter [Armatimonadetes bacterium]|nr:MFS transporter [Armatimonadota bacterium]